MTAILMKWFKSLMANFRAAFALPWHDRWVVLQAWIFLLLADLSVRTLPFSRVQRLAAARRRYRDHLRSDEKSEIIQHLRWIVSIAGRNHLFPMRCLQQSLVLQWLLGRRGIPTDLRIGVRKELDGLHAHAWLEQAGAAIAEREQIIASYAPLVAREADL